MQHPEVNEITVSVPIKSIGKVFTGDYAHSPKYITELETQFTGRSIPFIPNKVMGIYYDNPMEKKPEELKSFQGLFPLNESVPADETLTEMALSGTYLLTRVSGDPIKSIHEGYAALFDYIRKNNIVLDSNTGYQVSSFENGVITTEIYMKTK